MTYLEDEAVRMRQQIKSAADWAEKWLQDENADRHMILEHLIRTLRDVLKGDKARLA